MVMNGAYVARPEDGVALLEALGNVAELAPPPRVAAALQRPLAVPVHASGEEAALCSRGDSPVGFPGIYTHFV